VGRFLKLFTLLPIAECERLDQSGDINAAKITLADEITAMAHGRNKAVQVAATAHDIFVAGTSGNAIPSCVIPPDSFLPDGLPLPRALVLAGLAPSGKEARRRLQAGGIRINDAVETDPGRVLTAEEIEGGLVLAAGKKRFVRLQLDG